MPSQRKPYASDVTDAQWARIADLATLSRAPTGRKRVSQREALNACLYVLSTVHLISACAGPSLVAFINTGSSSEYGPCTRPMREADAPHPRDAYGVSKCAATLYASAVGRRGSPAVTLRLFSPYGPLDDPRRFIPTAIAAALAGSAASTADPVVGRDYVYVDDVIEAYLACVPRAQALAGAVINIGSGHQTTLGEVAEAVGRLIPNAPPPRWHAWPTSAQDSPFWQADITKARRQLGWAPRVGLDEGLRQTITYIQGAQSSKS